MEEIEEVEEVDLVESENKKCCCESKPTAMSYFTKMVVAVSGMGIICTTACNFKDPLVLFAFLPLIFIIAVMDRQ